MGKRGVRFLNAAGAGLLGLGLLAQMSLPMRPSAPVPTQLARQVTVKLESGLIRSSQ